MLFLKESFACYSSEVFNRLVDMPDFSGGVVGLTLKDLSNSHGQGATALRKLAEVFKIPDNVPVINFMLDEIGNILYPITPTFRLNRDGILGFSLGDFFATITDCYNAVMDYTTLNGLLQPYGDLTADILKINNDDKRLVAAFTFSLTPPKTEKRERIDKIEYSFAVGQNRKEEDADIHLVGLFEKIKDYEELIGALQASPYTGKIGAAYSIPLKKLPLGIYFMSNIDRLDETINKKDGTVFSKTGWSFEAVNAVTGAFHSVEAADSCFVGQHIKNSGEVALNKNAIKELGTEAPPLLKIAAVGKGGRALLILNDLKKAGTGLSPQGDVAIRETPEQLESLAKWLINKQLAQINARAEELRKEAEAEERAKLAKQEAITVAATPAVPAISGASELPY